MRRLLRLERAAALSREPYTLLITRGGKVVRVELVPPAPLPGPGGTPGKG